MTEVKRKVGASMNEQGTTVSLSNYEILTIYEGLNLLMGDKYSKNDAIAVKKHIEEEYKKQN